MNQTTLESVINHGLGLGARFVEIFEEKTRTAAVAMRDKKTETATAGTSYGIGLRMLFGDDVVYGYTGINEKEHLIDILNQLAASRSEAHSQPGRIVVMADKKNAGDRLFTFSSDPRDNGQQKKIEFLKRADRAAREISEKIAQVGVSVTDHISEIEIANSEGLWVYDFRPRIRFSVNATAEDGSERFTAHEAPGAGRGFEFIENLDIERYAVTASERALRMLTAEYIEGRKMPVIMGNGFGGVIFHEACGHPLETEAISRKASPFVGKLGEQIANPKVTAIDDGTIENSWGSIAVDDEGHPTQKTVLIENGVLKSYLSDRVGARKVQVPRTGSGRRESYKYAPVARMRNTYIDAGTDKVEEMLGSVEDGLYAVKMGGGSVNPATGEFNFAVEEGYRIKNGKIGAALRGATLIGKGHEIIKEISMVGDDLEITAGMCGASSGMVPVTVGQPTIKVDSILVGGR